MASTTPKTRKVHLKEDEKLVVSVPEGKLACFKWNGKTEYELVLVSI